MKKADNITHPVQASSDVVRRLSLARHGLIIAYYTSLTLLFTYPLIKNFATHFPGDGGDGYLFVWNFWYFKKQLLQGHNPFFTTDMFFPVGASLFFTSYTLVNDVLALVLFLFTSNIVLVSNTVFLLSFVLSGYCAFLLIDYLTGDPWAALFGGTIFAFCPYKLARLLGHFELTSTHWIPLFILVFLKTVDRKGTYRHAVLAGVIATLTMLDVYYYCIFLIFFVALFYLYQLLDPVRRREYFAWSAIKKAIVLGGAAVVLAAPFLLMAYRHAQAGYYETVTGWQGANDYVSDLTAFFTPSYLHPFWKRYLSSYYGQRLQGIESVVFIGWLVTLLTLIAVLYLARRRPEIRLWRFQFIAFVILSLGPTLHILGRYLFYVDEVTVSIPLPYFAVRYIPLLGHARAPSRLSVMFMLCAAILSAYTWIWLQEKMQPVKRARAAVWALLMLIILLEYINVPFPLCSASVPAVFYKIAREKNSGTILELPASLSDGVGARGDTTFTTLWVYSQTVHHKNRIGGYTGRGMDKAMQYLDRFPVMRNLFDLEEGKPIPIEELSADQKTVPDLIRQTALTYIVVHPQWKDKPSYHYVAQVFNLREPIYTDDGYLVYKVPDHLTRTSQGAIPPR